MYFFGVAEAAPRAAWVCHPHDDKRDDTGDKGDTDDTDDTDADKHKRH